MLRRSVVVLALLAVLPLAAPGAPDCGPTPVSPLGCVDGCPGEGVVVCDGAGVRVCERAADGCLTWRETAICGPGSVCEAGVCVGGVPYPGPCTERSGNTRIERTWSERGELVAERHVYDDVPSIEFHYPSAYDDAGRRLWTRQSETSWWCERVLAAYDGALPSPPADDACSVTRRAYDAAGNLVATAAGSTTWSGTYDAGDRLVREVRESSTGRTCTTHEYDDDGREWRETTDRECDGSPQTIRTFTWDGDRRQRRETDWDGDGEAEWWVAWSYEADGRVGTESAGPIGAAATSETAFGYDDAGRMVLQDQVELPERRPGYRITSAWSADGRTVTRREVWGGDDASERFTKEHFAEDGRVVRRTERELDGEQTVDSAWTYVLDDQGRVVEERSDTRYDQVWNTTRSEYERNGLEQEDTTVDTGGAPPWLTRRFTRDLWGRVVAQEEGYGAPSQRWTYRYDDAGRLVEMLVDVGFDGDIDIRERTTWNADGREFVKETFPADEAPRTVLVQRYDAVDRPVFEERFASVDGQLVGRTTWVRLQDGDRQIETQAQDGAGALGSRGVALDGVVDALRVRVTDARGRLLRDETTVGATCSQRTLVEYDDDRDASLTLVGCGASPTRTERTFDERGNVLTWSYDPNGDGAFEFVTDYDYSCFAP